MRIGPRRCASGFGHILQQFEDASEEGAIANTEVGGNAQARMKRQQCSYPGIRVSYLAMGR